jgi:hypothetical protein
MQIYVYIIYVNIIEYNLNKMTRITKLLEYLFGITNE